MVSSFLVLFWDEAVLKVELRLGIKLTRIVLFLLQIWRENAPISC